MGDIREEALGPDFTDTSGAHPAEGETRHRGSDQTTGITASKTTFLETHDESDK